MSAPQNVIDLAADAVGRARLDLVLDHPFFGALALRLRPVVDDSCTVAWTDGVRLGINPEAFLALTNAQRKGVIAHEVLHCANGHPWRQDARDHETWARACDRAINGIVTEAGMELPDGCEMPSPQEIGQAAEVIYAAMMRAPKSEGGDGQGNGSGQQQAFTDPGAMRSPESKDGKGKGGGKDGDQESEGEGHKQESTMAATELGELENQWKIATIQAAMMAKSRGELPGGIESLVDLVKKPPLDWRAELRRFMQQQAKNDYSWAKRNTRYMARGLYMPSLHSEEMGPVVIIRDTSGSVSQVEQQKFDDEVTSVIEEAKPEYSLVIQADAKINDVARFERGEFYAPPLVKGGGGTNFNPAFEYVEREGIRPACLIYLTDLEGPYPPAPPDFPVLWVCTTDKEATWGETIRLDAHA